MLVVLIEQPRVENLAKPDLPARSPPQSFRESTLPSSVASERLTKVSSMAYQCAVVAVP